MERLEIMYKNPLVITVAEENGWYLIHNYDGQDMDVETANCWVLPRSLQDGTGTVHLTGKELFHVRTDGEDVYIEGTDIEKTCFSDIPCCDIFGNRMILQFPGADKMMRTAAYFYWKTLLLSVVEKTRAAQYPIQDGYVVSTLAKDSYAGTYPDVDHEFQIKGRLAMGDVLDWQITERMMELQFKLMKEDPEQMWRDPCAIQPNGDREYHVRRNSMDNKVNAQMFLITGNVEIIESAWLYYMATKRTEWLEKHISDLEGAMSLVDFWIDANGKLWSDVYYEDQVMKDGRECMSAALAANSYRLLAKMEEILGRREQAAGYYEKERILANNMTQNLPLGFWDNEKKRFVDWVDRNGQVHDHIHLLANELPVLFGYAKEEQTAAVEELIQENMDAFQRFPSFMAVHIEDYTDSEIGDGGPYDLCAAGRYWCWDNLYWAEKGRGDILKKQLLAVCEQAELDDFLMGERYDMNHVYYISDKNWHGASYYYEYPNVFLWNLVSNYLGVRFHETADLMIVPGIAEEGTVCLEQEMYALEYTWTGQELIVTNRSDRERTFLIDLKYLVPGGKAVMITLQKQETKHLC